METFIALSLIFFFMGSAYLTKRSVGKPREPMSPVAADVNLIISAFASLGVVLLVLL